MPAARFRLASLAAIVLLAGAGFAPPAAARSYGESLLDRALRAFPGVTGLRIDATDKTGQPLVVTSGTAGAAGDRVVLVNAMAEPIGQLGISGKHFSHRQATRLAAWLARHIYVVGNLAEPDPFVAGALASSRSQTIVERALAADPSLVTLAFHVGASGADNRILASSFGRIGKPGDADDARVIDQGAVLRETTNQGARFAVELPLLDRQRRIVGALSVSYRANTAGADGALLRATALRNAIARQIPSLTALRN